MPVIAVARLPDLAGSEEARSIPWSAKFLRAGLYASGDRDHGSACGPSQGGGTGRPEQRVVDVGGQGQLCLARPGVQAAQVDARRVGRRCSARPGLAAVVVDGSDADCLERPRSAIGGGTAAHVSGAGVPDPPGEPAAGIRGGGRAPELVQADDDLPLRQEAHRAASAR